MKKIILLSLFLAITAGCATKKETAATLIKYMNTITAGELKTHLTIVASDEMEGRETGSRGQKKAGEYLISQYQKNGVPYPKGAANYYQKVPAAFMNRKTGTQLPDSENIWAFIEGSEKPEEIVVVSAHYDHIGIINGEIYNGADDDGTGTVALV
ncbi:MAG TPA: M28 family peptidase, partial [Flavobacterium sp.]|nr:M28 family peptidase [Flavobacterium sp.]